MKPPDLDPGDLSQLLEDLARVPRLPVPEQHFAGLPSGTKVGRFVIQREIGRGGFGVVYAATDPDLGRQVALKLLRQGIAVTRSETEWIRREAEAVARLNHPAIVTLFDSGSCEHGAFMVFELLQGAALDVKIARGPIEPREALRITSAVAGALEHAHAERVLHRDLKPANVFLCSSGVVKVLDFGVAQLFDRDARPTSGTPKYMAPEQRDGLAEDGRTDLYSLGVVLLAMLRGGNTELPAKPPPRTAGELERLAYDLTRHDPEQRPASARVVLDRLDGIRQRRSARRGWAVAALAAVLALGTWGAWEWTRPREAPPGERLDVVIAPTDNAARELELDHLSELIQAGLADSPRVRVIARPRVVAGLRELGAPPGTTVAEHWREAAGRLGARVVIFPKATRDGSGFAVTLTGRDAVSNAIRFQATATAPTLKALPVTLDGALQSLRRGAGERSDDLERTFRPVSTLTSPSLAAYRDYALGVACIDDIADVGGEDELNRCGSYFRRALEADPLFALAHYQVAKIISDNDHGSPELRKHLDLALLPPVRLSRRDETLVRALRDQQAGDSDAALRRYAALATENHGDVQAISLAGELLFHASRYAEAAPYLASLGTMDASYPWAFDHLVESYALSGREKDLTKLLDGVDGRDPSKRRAAVRGENWLGRHDRAVGIARLAQGEQPGSATTFLLLQALTAAGRFDESEAIAVSLSTSEPDNVPAFMQTVLLAARRGRSTEAWRLMEAPPLELSGPGNAELVILKVALAAGDRSVERLRAEVQKLVPGATEFLPVAAVQLALLGTRVDTSAMRLVVPSDSIAEEEIAALEAWKNGDVSRAVSMIAALERRAPRPNDALSPAYLLAEIAREVDPSEAAAAAERFRRRVPIGTTAGWTYGRSLLVSAEAAWRLGRRDEAMEFIGKAEELFKRADPGFPAVVETARLRKAIESGKPPQKGVHFGPR